MSAPALDGAAVAALRELLEKATAGPWSVAAGGAVVATARRWDTPMIDCYGGEYLENAELIAAAVNALPGLLDIAERPAGPQILYRNRGADWMAWTHGDTRVWECGPTREDAVGRLANRLAIAAEEPEPAAPPLISTWGPSLVGERGFERSPERAVAPPLALGASPGCTLPAWVDGTRLAPPPHEQSEFRFIGTPCYGMHSPFVVPAQPPPSGAFTHTLPLALLQWRSLPPTEPERDAGHQHEGDRAAAQQVEGERDGDAAAARRDGPTLEAK